MLQDIREWRESILLHLGLIRDLSPLENECCHGIATAIRDSPLLTEEDYHLLYFALLKPHPLDVINNSLTLIIFFKITHSW